MIKLNKKRESGFTLIEVIIYIGMFAIIIGGGLAAVYQIIQSSGSTNGHILIQEEANFILRKVDWALSGVAKICSPSAGNSANSMSVTKLSAPDCTTPSNLITFNIDTDPGNIRIERGLQPVLNLNGSGFLVSSVKFERSPAVTNKPDSITASFNLTTNIGGKPITESFSTTKYLRK